MSNQETPAAAGASVMAKAEREATQVAVLDLMKTVLIGIVGKTEALSALLRHKDGKIVKIARGDKIREGTVIGIDEGSVRLQKGGAVTVLRLPKT